MGHIQSDHNQCILIANEFIIIVVVIHKVYERMNMHCGGLLYGHSCHDRLWSRVGTRGRSRALLEGCQVNCTIEYKIGLHRSVRARKGVCVPLKANASEEETYVSPSSRTGSNELEALERYSEVCGPVLEGQL